jgi:hypothetical protein
MSNNLCVNVSIQWNWSLCNSAQCIYEAVLHWQSKYIIHINEEVLETLKPIKHTFYEVFICDPTSVSLTAILRDHRNNVGRLQDHCMLQITDTQQCLYCIMFSAELNQHVIVRCLYVVFSLLSSGCFLTLKDQRFYGEFTVFSRR